MISTILAGVFFSSFNSRLNGLFTLICMIGIYFVLSMRGLDVDRDAHVYNSVFNQISAIDINGLLAYSLVIGQEFGFLFLMKVCNLIGFDFFEFRFLYNAICLLSIIYLIFNYVPHKYRLITYMIYVSMFMLFRDFTQLRLTLACLLSIISILKCLDNSLTKSVIFLIFAISFHNTALIVLPIIIFLSRVKDNSFFYTPTFVFIVFFTGLAFFIIDPVKYIISLSFMPSQLTRYEGTEHLNSGGTLGLGFFVAIFVSAFLASKFKYYNINLDYKVLYWTMLFSSFISLVFYSAPILMRMQILLFTGIIFLPSVLYRYFLEKKIIVNYFFQIFFAIVFFLYFFKNLTSGIVYQYGTY